MDTVNTVPEEIEGANIASDFNIEEHHPYAAMGSDRNRRLGDMQSASLINRHTDIPSDFPVFINRFPFEQSGPIFDEGSATFEYFAERLREFLRIFYGMDDVSNHIIEQEWFIAVYRIGNMEILSRPEAIVISGNEHELLNGLRNDLINNTPLENMLVQIALNYLNINEPVTTVNTDYSLQGDAIRHVYIITDATNGFFENILQSSFSYIRISHTLSTGRVSLMIYRINTSQIHSYQPIIPFDIALDYIKTMLDVTDESRIRAEIYYSPSVHTGFFIPVYRFYIEDIEKDPVTEMTSFEVVHIPMVNFDPEEPMHLNVRTNEATNIASESATLNGSLANNSYSIEYGFYWGETNTPSNRVVVGTTDSESRSFSFNLEGLSPETTYFFRAFAGATQGGVMSFATEPGGSTTPATYEMEFTFDALMYHSDGEGFKFTMPDQSDVPFLPIIFRVNADGSRTDVSHEVVNVTYFNDLTHNMISAGEWGMLPFYGKEISITVEMASGGVLSASFGYMIEVVGIR